MERGFIRLWRKSIDSGLLQNHQLWCFWCWCLMKATHKPISQVVGFQKIELAPGQFIFGRNAASEETGISPQTIRTCIKNLKNMKNLTIKSTNKFSIITIINWDIYQPEKSEINQQINQQLTSNQPAANHKQEHKNKRINIYTHLEAYLKSKIQNGLMPYSEKIIEFFKYRQTTFPAPKRYKTEKGIDGLFRDIAGCQKAGLSISECLDITMEKNWLTPSPAYFNNIMIPNSKPTGSTDSGLYKEI